MRELQTISDSVDPLKRTRGRRGFDVLSRLQELATVEISERDFDDMAPGNVDARLVRLAQELGAKLITNDYNLNRVAHVEGVEALNVNELADAVKPVVLPGEELHVAVIREGKETHQGVGYLDDGTMIVVEQGRRLIGEETDVVVTSVLQTVAGRMIFARPRRESMPKRRPSMCERWAAVIVAAGRGERFGRPKQLIELAGCRWSAGRSERSPECRRSPNRSSSRSREWIEAMRELLARFAPPDRSAVVAGGATRQESVSQRVARRCRERCDAVLVHDGARPLVRAGDVRAGMQRGSSGTRRAAAAPVVDTIKVVDPGSRIRRAKRSTASAVGGADAAVCDCRRSARARTNAPERDGVEATDDAALLERIGVEVVVVESSSENFKVTHAGTTSCAREAVLRERSAP